MTQPTDRWQFYGDCAECGQRIPATVKNGEFRRNGDNVEYVITLEVMDVEAHNLTHVVRTT